MVSGYRIARFVTGRSANVALSIFLLAAGCGGGTTSSIYESFREELEAGASCSELFDIRGQAAPDHPDVERMNEDLGLVGCLSSSSTRQEPAGGGTDLYSINYKSSYAVCSDDPQETYRQAGTKDPAEAAAWLSEGVQQGEAYEGSYDGCLDGLTDKPNRFND